MRSRNSKAIELVAGVPADPMQQMQKLREAPIFCRARYNISWKELAGTDNMKLYLYKHLTRLEASGSFSPYDFKKMEM